TVIQQFDIPQAQDGEIIDKAMIALRMLAGDLDVEEVLTQADGGDDDDDDDNEDGEGWVDEHQGMLELELDDLDGDVQPVRTMLVKIRKIVFTIKNSSTLILPKWVSTLKDLNLSCCMMPWDVSTQWNSTYDMLNFAVTYSEALDIITGDREM
ncbi:hypothetical protein B0F90DRAFT_1574480, partial [Multifurca ochricompacta]